MGAIYFCPVNSRWRTTPRYSITPASGRRTKLRSCAPCWVHSCMLCCVRSWPTRFPKDIAGPLLFHLYIFLPTIFSAGFIPFFITPQKAHLINSFWVYVRRCCSISCISSSSEPSCKAYPRSWRSARIDGYGDFQIFVRIILPLSGPVLATISLFIGVAHWNDWFSGAYYVSNKDLIPVQTLLQEMLTEAEALSNSMRRAAAGRTDDWRNQRCWRDA